MTELFTIGHSTHTWEQFLGLLEKHGIKAIADVRSSPYSARLPQFNRELLDLELRKAGVQYAFVGDELGARRTETDCYVDGVARYDLIAQTPSFRAGLERVMKGSRRYRLALLCAEGDPLECHRTILVCRHLKTDLGIQHVLPDGRLETHAEAESRLLAEERVPAEDFFMSADTLLARAYDQRGAKIAYHECSEVPARA